MFGHLDDPEEVSAGGRQFDRVLRRAEIIKVRRRWLAALGAACIIAAGSIGFTLSQTRGTSLSTSNAAFQFSSLRSPVSAGTPVPATALVNVVFPNANDGFALAAHRGSVLLAASTDGGASWVVRNDHLPTGLGSGAGFPGQIEFVGFTGFLWDATGEESGLWVTENDGATWRQITLGPYVYDVSAIGTNVWALSGSCVSNIMGDPPCSLELNQSLNGGQSWSVVSAVPEPGGAQASADFPRVELARITHDRAYVLAQSGPATNATTWSLEYTADGGATWTARLAPCRGAFEQGVEIAASSTKDLWLLCGSQASVGNQSKQLYRSDDGGATWKLAAAATGVGSPPPSATQNDPLPLFGYIAPFSVGHRNLAVASPSTAWLYPSYGGLFVTRDSGRSWVEVPTLTGAGFGAGGTGNVTFASSTLGWICQYGVGLWHTTDGVHWTPLAS